MRHRDRIERIVIHPAIGIARVGNSPNQFFIGPEVPGVRPADPDNFRDARGRIKRQAARFRLYGVNAHGEVVREVTARDAEITWTVHLANKKAAWFRFDQALDIPASQGLVPGVNGLASNLRNRTITGAQRKHLVIDPGPRSIRRPARGGRGRRTVFDSGKFFGKPVYLGELRADAEGRLLVLGGRGHSASRDDSPVTPGEFANNDGWHDDISDGPVDATARIGKERYRATGAWVVVAPPDYAPGVLALVTGYDLVYEVATRLDRGLKPKRPSFARHVYPLLARFARHQWVNAGFFREFGWGAPLDLTRPEVVGRLNDPGEANRPFREALFGRFRDPGYPRMQADAWPAIYGDAVTLDMKTTDPREWMAVLETQYEWLRRWAAGDFDADGPPARPKGWAEMSPAEQAAALDEAALENTTGGPFHPGAEFTWPMRQPILYEAPFRIERRAGGEPDLGAQLTAEEALRPGGPLDGSGPGDLTRWMACPWQTDTASCLSAYRPYGGEYLPTFWPARVPNDVLTEDDYQVVVDEGQPLEERVRAFGPGRRKRWLRGIKYVDEDRYPPSVNQQPVPTQVFVTAWDRVGIVTHRPGPENQSPFPADFWVETGRTFGQQPAGKETPIWDENPRDHR